MDLPAFEALAALFAAMGVVMLATVLVTAVLTLWLAPRIIDRFLRYAPPILTEVSYFGLVFVTAFLEAYFLGLWLQGGLLGKGIAELLIREPHLVLGMALVANVWCWWDARTFLKQTGCWPG